ncbi:MAG: lipid-binding protein [Parabacteroides sp.]|nr:lipid-binding protein [Parabacteroides sp.]
MKKIFYFLSIFAALILSSCMEDIDSWNSETLDYAGRYVFKLMSENMQETYIEYGSSEIQIYNTAQNVANEIWLDDGGAAFPMKSKFLLTGDASSFKSTTEDFAQLFNNILSIDDLPTPSPTAAGQTVEEEEKSYIRATILDGKILPKQATSIGGNKSDSLYLKIKLYSGTAIYESYEKPVSLRKDPAVAEFAWKFKSATHDSSKDATYVIGGYRYTGMPEDR